MLSKLKYGVNDIIILIIKNKYVAKINCIFNE